MALQHLRSSVADKRPVPANMADGQIAINTNTSTAGLFFKNASGNLVKVGPVHVGTTAPNAVPAAGGQAGNSVGEQWLDTTGGGYKFKIWDGTAWRSEDGEFINANGDVMTGALGIIAGSQATPGLYFSGDPNTGIYSPGADQLALSANGTEVFRVDSSRRLLVGTSSTPAGAAALLQVQGYAGAPTGVGLFELKRGAAVPANGDELGRIDFSSSASERGASITAVRDGGTWTTGSSYPGRLVFATTADGAPSPTERMRIQSNGSYRLLNDTAAGVNQSQDITDINFEGRVWYSSSGSGTMQNIFRPKTVYVASGGNGLHYCGFDFIRVSPSGTPGNGSGPEVNMEFRGNTGFRILSGATYGTISDAKVKDNIVDATPKLSDLMQLQVRNFSLKGAPETKFIGFIAQELEEVFPTLVTSSKDYVMDEETGELVESDTETKGIKESALIPILVKSLQEAVARIEALEVEVASLKA